MISKSRRRFRELDSNEESKSQIIRSANDERELDNVTLLKKQRFDLFLKSVGSATLLSWSCVAKRYVRRTELLVELIIKEESETRAVFFFYLAVKTSITSFALDLFDSRSVSSAISTVKV